MAKAFEPGDHGSTFGGNPLACSAAIAALEIILEENLVENSEKMGAYFIEKLSELAKKYDFIKEVRGKGLMIAVEFSTDNAVEIKNKCFEEGYLIGNVGNSIIRILPPLIISKKILTKW